MRFRDHLNLKFHLQSLYKDPCFFLGRDFDPARKAHNYSLSFRTITIFDSALSLFSFFNPFILMHMNFVSFCSAKSLLISQIHCRSQIGFFQAFVGSHPACDSWFFFHTRPDLSKRSLETVLLHLSSWPVSVAPFCISFSSIPPQISLTLQSPLAL